ncbi:hypothetical protein [Methylobacterium radiotolerans]|uniref:Uncharacterized protein n=1 Tax=Methylobacterium radiotolerans (strain ATCC 27329 / DSM 1819 / JCM 2831 / NBRC 15690 / NCIMB 10815 / 0-1) TaxID=426355 RepID=B1LXD3_METRJ|nr:MULTISPECIES: hypothetical protein [Methylobacterium]ACB27254.1 hypothetical protein Mrad2831_5307 [Methylobacterium radiotolerans JCM 2831]GEM98249.1 hypothetical protein MRA01_27890 [Methylobacterium radiotolerans]
MLKDDELDELARAVAALDDKDAGRLKGAVLELRHRRQAMADVARIAKLQAMSDFDAFEAAIDAGQVLTVDVHTIDKALQVIREAGFVRGKGLKVLYRAGWNDALNRYPNDGDAEYKQARDNAIERVLMLERV